MEKVTDGIHFIQGRDDMFPDSNTYLLGEPDSNDLTLVDPGMKGKGDYKIRSIIDAGIDLKGIKRVIMTHTHFDHIGCLGEIKEKIPWSELWIHEREVSCLEQGDERCVYGMEMLRQMCVMQYGVKTGDFLFDVDIKLQGGENIDIGGMSWEIVYLPGHSPGSIGLYNKEKKALVPGDVIYADYAIGRFDLHGASGHEHRDSLLRLSELEVDILLPGHNRIDKEVNPGYIAKTLKKWEPYLK